MQGLRATSVRASESKSKSAPPRSINCNFLHDSLTFAYWLRRPLVALAGIGFLVFLIHRTTCTLRESVDSYCTFWHRFASTINRTLPSISGESSISCEAPLCFDEDIGARLINNEITHLTNILNLVDGCGRPFTKVFDPHSERQKAALNMALPKNTIDTMSVDFTSSIIVLLSRTRRLDAMFIDTVWAIVRRFSHGHVVEKQLRRALKRLRDIQSARQASLQQDLSGSQRQLDVIEVDHLIHTTIAHLVGNLSLQLGQMLPHIRNTTFFVESLYLQGAHIAADLDSEVPRVTEILKGIPWWETWATWSRIWRYSKVEYFETYLQNLKSEGPHLRLLAEDIQIFTDNLRTLHEYCIWYLGRQPSELTKGFSSTSTDISLDDIAFAIDKLVFEADLVEADALRSRFEVPPRRPHRVRLLAVPSVLSQ